MTTYKMKKFRSNQNKPSTTINMSEAIKKRQDVYVYQKEKWKESVAEKTCAEPRSYIIKTQDGKIYRRNRNSCDLSNLKKHLLRYLTMKTTMSMMRIKLIMRSWKSNARIILCIILIGY